MKIFTYLKVAHVALVSKIADSEIDSEIEGLEIDFEIEGSEIFFLFLAWFAATRLRRHTERFWVFKSSSDFGGFPSQFVADLAKSTTVSSLRTQ